MTDTLEFIHPQLRPLALPIKDLNEDPANANAHNAASLSGIAASFLKFGQRKPVVVRREGMVVEAGNGTLAALKREGWTHLACVVCDDDEAMAAAYALADNRTAQLATWDYEQLTVNVQALVAANFDCASLGWSSEQIEGIVGGGWTGHGSTGGQGDGGAGPTDPEAIVDPPAGNGAVEIDIDAMEFAHQCPRCKFEFNDTERRKPARDGDKTQARRRVQTLIDNRVLAAPNDVPCSDCGDVECESPHEYDHYLGYGGEHHEDVQAVCSKCHHEREAERVRLGIAP